MALAKLAQHKLLLIMMTILAYQKFAAAGYRWDWKELHDPVEGIQNLFSKFLGLITGKTDQKFLKKNIIPILAFLSKSDGKITRAEINIIERWMNQDLKLSSGARGRAVKLFKASKNDKAGALLAAERLAKHFAKSPDTLTKIIRFLFTVAKSDNFVSRKEEALIRKVALRFGMPHRRYEGLRSQFSIHSSAEDSGESSQADIFTARGSGNDYKILGCNPADTITVIRKRYRSLAKSYHPDAQTNRNLSKQQAGENARKFTAITEAYERIVEEKRRHGKKSA